MAGERIQYLTYHKGEVEMLTSREVVSLAKEMDGENLWSARFTGILGLPDCPAGNRGPKDEVVFALGQRGLAFLICLGFIPCPTCQPENKLWFWDDANASIEATYHLDNISDFALLDFDARRVNWEFLLPHLKRTPSRLYIPQLPVMEAYDKLLELKERFRRLGFDLPPVGYYDRNAPDHFFEYRIPS